MSKGKLAYEETFSCVQCGYCLTSCPTYVSMGKETHSPRGRINLVKMAAEGKITYSELEGPISLCLGCRACEVACPTNVKYGIIFESAIELLAANEKKEMPRRKRIFQEALFGKLIPNKKALNIVGTGMAIYQKTGIQKLARKSGVLKIIPENLRAFEAVLPRVEGLLQKRKRQTFYPTEQNSKYSIGFFTGCIMDTMFSSINTLSIKLLQASGCDVTIISDQTCCGALQNHSGEVDITKGLAKKNIEAFEKHEFDFIVNSIGGCGAMLVEYDKLLANEQDWKERAGAFVKKIADISIILSKLKLPFKKEISKVVTYQPSCHMTNVQKKVTEPLELLQSIPGIQYQELPNKNLCCGSAGIYNIVNFNESMDVLDGKMTSFQKIPLQPEIIVTTNPGCHLQMKLGVERIKKSKQIRTVHLVELLAESCDITV